MWRAAHPLTVLGGETATGAAILDRALALNPNAASAWIARGRVLVPLDEATR
jgi:hypothetical protein